MMRNKKNIIIISFAVLAGVLVGYYFTFNQGEQTAGPSQTGSLIAKEAFYDFGEILMQNGKVEHNFEIQNTSQSPVKIEKIYTSCMCTEAFLEINGKEKGPFGMPGHAGASRANITVNGGETAVLKVVFDPAAHGPAGIGLMERTAYIETDSEETPQTQIDIRAVVNN